MDWIKSAKVGDKVVSFKNEAWKRVSGNRPEVRKPEFHEICEINRIADTEFGIAFGFVGFEADSLFMAKNFRPVQPRSTDITFAHEILKSVSEKKPVGEPA